VAAIWHGATKGLRKTDRAPSGLDWVGDMPRHWGLPSVGANFHIQLGKMLNPDAAQAGEQYRYLRNVNVQWDRIDLDDLNEMHFDARDRLRYALEPGDLIVCEGGEVGRAALWEGTMTWCYYQKALHRVRPRRDANARYLMYALWAAASRGVFENEGNTSTIVHLTAEKLGAHRFPWPPKAEQDEVVKALDRVRGESERMKVALGRQVELLLERRRAVVTAAVTGQLDIPGVAA
jgi:type I restriction enzyme, S subunit